MEGESRSPKRPSPRFRASNERPCYKLSVDLLNTYKQINELFYAVKRKRHVQSGDNRKPVFNDGYDDDQGNYIVQIGEEIAGRYITQECLGKGSFGVVVKAHDHRRDECVAVKIIKNKVQFFHQAKVEIEILTKLNSQAGEEHNIVKLKKVFSWKEHLCLVFELLSFNLYDLLKYTKFNGVSLNLIRKFAYQILKTLDFLASTQTGVIHCDLKPENILLKNPKRSGIKVIDFGSSCFVNKKMFKYIQSRFYRSPEVILGLPYDCAIDMWSLACILVEMHTGQPLFDGKDESEQLIKMSAVLSAPPQRLIEQSPKRKNFFQWDSKQKRWILAPPNRDPSRYPKSTVEDIIGVHTGGPGGRRKGQPGHSEVDYLNFLDLIKKMLCYNAQYRITPSAALQHPFLNPVGGGSSELPCSPAMRMASPSRNPASPYNEKERRNGASEISATYTNHGAERDRRESRVGLAGTQQLSRSTATGGSDHLLTQLPVRERRSSVTSNSGATTAYSQSSLSSSIPSGLAQPFHGPHTVVLASSSPHSSRTGPTSPHRAHAGVNGPATVSMIRNRSSSHSNTYEHSTPSKSYINPTSPSTSHRSSPSHHNLDLHQTRDIHHLNQKPSDYLLQSATLSPTSSTKPKQPGGTAQVENTIPTMSSPRRFSSLLGNGSSIPTMGKYPSPPNNKYPSSNPGSPHEMRAYPGNMMSPDRRYGSPSTGSELGLGRKYTTAGDGERTKIHTSPSPSTGSTTSGDRIAKLEERTASKYMDSYMKYPSPERFAPTSSPATLTRMDPVAWRYNIPESYRDRTVHHGGAEPMMGLNSDRSGDYLSPLSPLSPSMCPV